MLLVTGGCGFIGSNFILEWLKHNDEEIINLDLLTYAGANDNLSQLSNKEKYFFEKGCISDEELLRFILQKFKPRAVLNFAAESHVDRSISQPNSFIKTNIVGTASLLSTCLEYWQQLKTEAARENFRFLQVSTDEVYGSLQRSDPPFNESNAYKPNSPYSASKASADHLVRAYNKTFGFPTLTTNCSNNYGPFQIPEKLIPLSIIRALNWEKIPVYGDGRQIRDWLFVLDHCTALRTVLEKGRTGSVYNIGGHSEIENIELVTLICDRLDAVAPQKKGRSFSELITFVSDRLGHDERYAVDTKKIEKELGWSPNVNLKAGLAKTVDWYINNEKWLENSQKNLVL